MDQFPPELENTTPLIVDPKVVLLGPLLEKDPPPPVTLHGRRVWASRSSSVKIQHIER